jgi:hypothetical protein
LTIVNGAAWGLSLSARRFFGVFQPARSETTTNPKRRNRSRGAFLQAVCRHGNFRRSSIAPQIVDLSRVAIGAKKSRKRGADVGQQIFHRREPAKKNLATPRRSRQRLFLDRLRAEHRRKFGFRKRTIFAPFDSTASSRTIGVSGDTERLRIARLSQQCAAECRSTRHVLVAPG